MYSLCDATHKHVVDESSLHMCTDEWLPTPMQYTLHAPQSSLQKAQEVSPNHAQSKAQMKHPQRIPGCWGYFKCYMYHVMALGWMKKEEEQEEER